MTANCVPAMNFIVTSGLGGRFCLEDLKKTEELEEAEYAG